MIIPIETILFFFLIPAYLYVAPSTLCFHLLLVTFIISIWEQPRGEILKQIPTH